MIWVNWKQEYFPKYQVDTTMSVYGALHALDSLARNGDPAIPITEVMYEAGVAALVSYDPRVELEEEVVARIYRAMVALALQPKSRI